MELMRLADVPSGEPHHVYRHSPARALLLAGGALAALVLLLALGWWRQNPLVYYAAGVVGLGVLIMRRNVLARLRPSNWLVRASGEGLFIQFRSHLNWHFPSDDPTVVFVPYQELRSARGVRETSTLPSSDAGGGVVTRRRRLVELELTDDAPELARALDAERVRRAPKEARWYGRSSRRYHHHPVRMVSPRRMQIEWSAVPGVEAFLSALPERVRRRAEIDVATDYAELSALDRAEQKRRLLELVERGQTLDAIRIARKLYAYDLRRAREFVKSLRGT